MVIQSKNGGFNYGSEQMVWLRAGQFSIEQNISLALALVPKPKSHVPKGDRLLNLAPQGDRNL
ncbi:hypothetical protein IQ235_09965 [Oscillatoriales cyanobacterium LEGE 11467]|uniref:Uncharacterized protein n=1 Tax=Zarconia navalis LEGE 11467 TaxID=1828826 RepID=A0A928VXI2_9CYAN|nr:hypothetical protein [Zarconia navalis]MBE9041103.1 hypothetical protein [Zarconia navalis LEGE 11467]